MGTTLPPKGRAAVRELSSDLPPALSPKQNRDIGKPDPTGVSFGTLRSIEEFEEHVAGMVKATIDGTRPYGIREVHGLNAGPSPRVSPPKISAVPVPAPDSAGRL